MLNNYARIIEEPFISQGNPSIYSDNYILSERRLHAK